MHQARTPVYDHPRALIDPHGSSCFGIFDREIFFPWISSGEKWTTRARIASSGRARRNRDFFRIALSINKNTCRLHRYHAGSRALRRTRADKEIRGIPSRRRRRASRTLSVPSAEGRNRALYLLVIAGSMPDRRQCCGVRSSLWGAARKFPRINEPQAPSNPATQTRRTG